MPLFETTAVDAAAVRQMVLAHWDLELGDLIKASQNHTFAAKDSKGHKAAVRATPDPQGIHTQRIEDELLFVNFLKEKAGLKGVCSPLPMSVGGYVAREGDLTIVVYSWAEGEAVDFAAYKWMTDFKLVQAWGAWMASQHAAAKLFAAAHPEVAARMPRWDQIHDGVMAGTEATLIAPEDVEVAAAGLSSKFGILHGDLNISNFFVVPGSDTAPPTLSVFDWDQAHQGWWEWDMAQSSLAVLMLAEAGSIIVGDPVAEANPQQFLDWFVTGYEAVAGAGSVDKGRLARMVRLRKAFYGRFATRAFREGDVLEQMEAFLRYVDKWANQ